MDFNFQPQKNKLVLNNLSWLSRRSIKAGTNAQCIYVKPLENNKTVCKDPQGSNFQTVRKYIEVILPSHLPLTFPLVHLVGLIGNRNPAEQVVWACGNSQGFREKNKGYMLSRTRTQIGGESESKRFQNQSHLNISDF